MDLQLRTGYLLHGPKYDFDDPELSFETQNGFGHGVALQLNVKPTVAIKASYMATTTRTVFTHKWSNYSDVKYAGVLTDHIITLGVRKQFPMKKGWSIAAHVSAYADPFQYEAESLNGVIATTVNPTLTNIGQSTTEVGIHNVAGNTWGAMGGIGVEKSWPNLGKFFLGVSYGFDLSKGIERRIVSRMYEYQNDGIISSELMDENKLIEDTFPRNIFLIEFGFKMPGAIIFERKEKKEEPEEFPADL